MKKLFLLTILTVFGSSWAMAQEKSKVKPPNGMSEIAAYSVYLSNYNQKSYKGVINFGRWIWVDMPESIKGYDKFDLPRNLKRLITAYEGVAKDVQDPSVKEAYIDTALMIFDKTFDKYSKDQIDYTAWYIKKGRFYQSNSDFVDNATQNTTDSYYKAYQAEPKKFTQKGDGYYMKVMLDNMVSEGDEDKALAVIKKTEPYASDKLKEYFDKQRNKLFDSPDERIAFLKQKVENNPKDEKALSQLRDLYKQQGMDDKANKLSKKLYDINPDLDNTSALADMAIGNANYNEAIKYLKEALNKTDNNQDKAKLALKISNAYMGKEDLPSARRYARKASSYDKGWGEPYIKIADIYAQSVSQCTSNRKMDEKDRVVYWLVLDYLDKAKRVDSSTSSEVQRKYKAYKPVTPTSEQKFFNDWKKGKQFKINGSLNKCYSWIDETTTVR